MIIRTVHPPRRDFVAPVLAVLGVAELLVLGHLVLDASEGVPLQRAHARYLVRGGEDLESRRGSR